MIQKKEQSEFSCSEVELGKKMSSESKQGILEKIGGMIEKIAGSKRSQILALIAGALAVSGCGLSPGEMDTSSKKDSQGIQGPAVAGSSGGGESGDGDPDRPKLGSKTIALSKANLPKGCYNPYFADKNTLYYGYELGGAHYGIQKITIKSDGSLDAPVNVTGLPKSIGARGLMGYMPNVNFGTGKPETLAIDAVGALLKLNTTKNTWELASQFTGMSPSIDSHFIYLGDPVNGRIGVIDPNTNDTQGYWQGTKISITPLPKAAAYYPTPGANGTKGWVAYGYTYYCEQNNPGKLAAPTWTCTTRNFPYQPPTTDISGGVAHWCNGVNKSGKIASSNGTDTLAVDVYNDCPVKPTENPAEPSAEQNPEVQAEQSPEEAIQEADAGVEVTPEEVFSPELQPEEKVAPELQPEEKPQEADAGTEATPEEAVNPEPSPEEKVSPENLPEENPAEADGGTPEKQYEEAVSPDEKSSPEETSKEGGTENVPEPDVTPEKPVDKTPVPFGEKMSCDGLADVITFTRGQIVIICGKDIITVKLGENAKGSKATFRWQTHPSEKESSITINGAVNLTPGGRVDGRKDGKGKDVVVTMDRVESYTGIITNGEEKNLVIEIDKKNKESLTLLALGTDFVGRRSFEDFASDLSSGKIQAFYNREVDGKMERVEIKTLSADDPTMAKTLAVLRRMITSKFSERPFPTERPITDGGTDKIVDTDKPIVGCGGCNTMGGKSKDPKKELVFLLFLLATGGGAISRKRNKDKEVG